MSDRKDHIRNLNALNAICGQKDFYDKEMEESLRFAINSLEVDEAYQLEYEHIPYITLDELKEIREEIDHSGKDLMNGTSAEYAYTRGWNDALDYVLLAILDKKISELEGEK